MAQRSIIIIGAGLAGLATGCYAQMNGYQTRIFEQHTRPGGVCTARGGVIGRNSCSSLTLILAKQHDANPSLPIVSA